MGNRGCGERREYRSPLPRLNNLTAFAVVNSAMRSGVVPRSSASFAAVAVTKAGSLRAPRCGTGARNGASVSTSNDASGTRSSAR